MKIKLLLLCFLLITYWGCDSEKDNSSEPEKQIDYSAEISQLFKVNTGDTFTYSVDTLNLTTGKFESIGTRSVEVNNKVEDGDYGYYSCSEKYELTNESKESVSKFRITETTLDFYADRSGVPDLIPDSIVVEIILDLNEVYNVVQFPYENNEWPVYKGTAEFGSFKFNIFNVTGMYVGEEILQLDGFSNGITTKKFKYFIELNIPNINDPFASNIQNYDAHLWISPEIGVVKIEGSSMFVNPITGKQFDDADSNKVSRHILTSYN